MDPSTNDVFLVLWLVPYLLAWLVPSLQLVFSPRGAVYSNEILPLLLSPVAWPESRPIALSRLLQIGLFYCLDNPSIALGLAWIDSIALALIRTGSGYLLTRSVGWAYPALFSHWALYETSSGLGAGLVGYLVIADPPYKTAASKWLANRWTLPVIVFAFCWLECRPWAYGTALAFAYPIAGLIQISRTPPLPKPVSEKPSPPARSFSSSVASTAAVLVPWLILYHIVAPTRLPLPETDRPLVDILMLSYPRPVDDETSVAIINSTITSYLPHLSPAVTLSLFTHTASHESLKRVYHSLNDPSITLHADTDTHPADHNGHYLHLAEAFRWILEDDGHKGEWVMLVEDDFTICDSLKGWDVIATVVNRLETDRQKGIIRSGFVGTGGSGLIIHRSYLPTLVFLLRTLSAADSPLHPDFVRRLPDQIIHDCLLGRQYSFCERRDADQSKLIIASRLVLDHIGGMATTTMGKPGNVDKWRCGWRHAFHSDELVEVVVV